MLKAINGNFYLFIYLFLFEQFRYYAFQIFYYRGHANPLKNLNKVLRN